MTQREQFEAWAAARGWSIRRHVGGRNNNAYMDLRTKSAWAGACWRSIEYVEPVELASEWGPVNLDGSMPMD